MTTYQGGQSMPAFGTPGYGGGNSAGSSDTGNQGMSAGSSPGNSGSSNSMNQGNGSGTTASPIQPNAPANANSATNNTNIPSTITIQAGDTLSGLAQRLGTNIQELMRLNPNIKNPNVIQSGAALNVPGGQPAAPAAAATPGNQYQANVQKAVNTVPDQNDVAAVRSAAAAVPFSSQELLPPSANDTVQGLISTYISQVTQHQQQGVVNLTDDYKNTANELGIPALQTQYMNLENVINGTPDDIRAEVTKSGGFMSESQVQALSASRNKNLINQANMIQQQLTNAQSTLSDMTGLDEKQQALAEQQFNDSTGATQNLISYYQTAQTQSTDQFKALVANVGYTGLASNLAGNPYEQNIAEQSLGLQPGTLSNPKALANLETYRQQSLQQGAAKIVELGAQTAYYNSGSLQRLTGAASAITQDYTTSPEYQVVANAAPYLNKINSDMQIPGSVSDQSMLDAITKLDTGGNAITEGQLQTLTGGRSIGDTLSVFQKKLSKGGVLSNSQRNQISQIAQSVYSNYEQTLAPLYQQTLSNLSANGLDPSQAGLLDFSNIIQQNYSPNNNASSSQSSTGSQPGYTVGQVYSNGNVKLTYQADGTFSGSDGHTYDASGDQIK